MHASISLLAASFALFHPVFAVPAPAEVAAASFTAPGNTAVAAHQTDAPAPQYPNPPVNWQGVAEPEPIRGDGAGAAVLGPTNPALEQENPELIMSPSTDAGSVDNSKWAFAMSHNRLAQGGWARQQNVKDMPTATEMAGVNMRLKANTLRELHWHTAGEWSYMLSGSARINAVDQHGKAYAANVYPGDLWYFPPGIPHSIQGLDDIADGCEFLLVFDSGEFDENDTFAVTDWFAHVPKETIAKNFKVATADLTNLPGKQLWIFPGNNSNALADDLEIVKEAGEVANPFSFALSKVNGTTLEGGSVKIVDSTTFKASVTISMAEVTVEANGIREMHWHPTAPEWTFFLEGNARMTIFAANGNSRTYDYQAGDIAYVAPSFGHYVESTSNKTLKFLEIFKSPVYEDISLSQWLAYTPKSIVKSTLDVGDDFINHLSKVKPVVVSA